jgi:hypothetical protein
LVLGFESGSSNGIENGAGQKIRPVTFEEGCARTVVTAEGARFADESIAFEPNQDLFRAILDPFGTESEILQWSGPSHRHLVPVWAATTPGDFFEVHRRT